MVRASLEQAETHVKSTRGKFFTCREYHIQVTTAEKKYTLQAILRSQYLIETRNQAPLQRNKARLSLTEACHDELQMFFNHMGELVMVMR